MTKSEFSSLVAGDIIELPSGNRYTVKSKPGKQGKCGLLESTMKACEIDAEMWTLVKQ